MAAELTFLGASHPQWRGGSAFADVYQPLVRLTYSLRQEKPHPIFVPDGNPTPQQCALCGGTEPRVTFKELSHIVSAALGNRRWFSREECDDCNHKYEGHENELANMLSAARVMGRVRARHGTAKIKAPGGQSSIGGGRFDDPLIVNVHAEDPSVKLEWIADRKLRLTFPQPGFRPFLAVRSLVRACWLRMTVEDRARYPSLLDVIAGDLDPELNEYVDVRLFDGMYNYVMLEGWGRKEGSEAEVAPFALRLCFVNRVLIWTSPDPSTGKHVPSPLPPVPIISDVSAVRGELRGGPSSASFKAGTVTQTIVYEQRVTGTAESMERPKPLRLERDVKLELENKSGTIVIDKATETVYEYDAIDARLRRRVAGGGFAGSINIFAEGENIDISGAMSIAGHTTSEARNSYALLRQMLNEGGTLRTVVSGQRLGIEVEPSKVPYRDEDVEELLESLGRIEQTFGVTFTFPNPMTDDYASVVSFLTTAISEGRVVGIPGGPMTITLSPTTPHNILTALAAGQDLSLDTTHTFVLFGQPIPPILNKMTLVAPRIEDDTIDDILVSLQGGQNVDVRLSVAQVVHTFPQWQAASP
jgi:hypothetical protein